MFAFGKCRIMLEILRNESNPDLTHCPKGQESCRKGVNLNVIIVNGSVLNNKMTEQYYLYNILKTLSNEY